MKSNLVVVAMSTLLATPAVAQEITHGSLELWYGEMSTDAGAVSATVGSGDIGWQINDIDVWGTAHYLDLSGGGESVDMHLLGAGVGYSFSENWRVDVSANRLSLGSSVIISDDVDLNAFEVGATYMADNWDMRLSAIRLKSPQASGEKQDVFGAKFGYAPNDNLYLTASLHGSGDLSNNDLGPLFVATAEYEVEDLEVDANLISLPIGADRFQYASLNASKELSQDWALRGELAQLRIIDSGAPTRTLSLAGLRVTRHMSPQWDIYGGYSKVFTNSGAVEPDYYRLGTSYDLNAKTEIYAELGRLDAGETLDTVQFGLTYHLGDKDRARETSVERVTNLVEDITDLVRY